ncbi:SAM-dependent methyltransferase [Rhodopseudomonas sp. AAP120]|uniref:class I SAM-dependent methyltransferase n=1 Tax=Rhodopseudomonas sp. AAP120 TaxID=1523430 RepID=UPI0006B9D540|nr:class I SAM-dependent methyltransferase [Rhodopseudomonas sp. AAP120]KPG00984.1 SAM-dependent methyltransferase [Rhodopseudomonas sp. AAP120]
MTTAFDADTLAFYQGNAADYAAWSKHRHVRLNAFLERLPAGAAILELGCGAGADSAHMIAQGFAVRPTDGSPQMAAQAAQRLGREVETLLFHQLDDIALYDGVWANACLLHVPRDELGGVLTRIWRALKPGGWFYASYKGGEGEGRDKLARYYNYPTEAWLRERYGEAGAWSSLAIDANQDTGFDNKPAEILHVTVQKAA